MVAMSSKLKSSVGTEIADKRRLGGNYLSDCIHDELTKYFGPLALFVEDKKITDPIFLNCYVKDFLNHSDEKKSLIKMESIFYKNMDFIAI